MTAFLRDCTPEMEAAIAANAIRYSAELFTITLIDGSALRWTNFDSDLKFAGQTFSSQSTFLSRSSWKVSNTMEVPDLSVKASSLASGFNGGASLQAQIHDGLLDGALLRLEAALMGADANPDTLGTIALFVGKVGGIDLNGIAATIGVKGKVNDLDQYAPRNLYQISCNHAFCDLGCGLSRADFTAGFTVAAAPTLTFIPWTSAPGNATSYQNGTLALTSGPAAGSRRTITQSSIAGLTLAYPLPVLPAAGDAFTAFQGCDKSQDSGSPQSCSARSNIDHYRGFPFVPPPTSSY